MKKSGFLRSDFQGIFYHSDLEDISLFGLIVATVFGLIYVVLNIKYTDVVCLFGLALLIVFGLTFGFKLILKSAGISDLQGIIRDSDWYPSLSRVQFLSWTFIIGIAFVWIFLLKAKYAYVHSAEMDITKLTVPDNLLLLMGITSLTTVVSKGLSSIKYTGKREKQSKSQLPNLGTMFQENERPSITRYQIFLWTSISVLAYFVLVFGSIINSYNADTNSNILSLTIPDCPQVLLFLMGISQATYLGGKFTSQVSEKPSISRIVPLEAKIGDLITIYGLNFGEKKASVLLDKIAVADDCIDTWNNSMIKIKFQRISTRLLMKYIQ